MENLTTCPFCNSKDVGQRIIIENDMEYLEKDCSRCGWNVKDRIKNA